MRYIIYCRKSTESEDRQVLSLDAQENELRDIATRERLNVMHTFRESKTAKAEGRPQFNEMMKMLSDGKADAVLCWKLDRLARNFIDGGKVIDLLQRGKIQAIQTHSMLHKPSDNVLMLAVELGMANQYIRDLSVNVKRGNRAKLQRGEWPNQAPFGYLNDKVNKTIVIDPKRGPYVKKMFKLYSTGSYSFKTLADFLYESGLRTRNGKKLHKSNMQDMLKRRFYAGVMERDGKTYEGNYTPLITKQLFDDVQNVMHGHARPRPQRHFFSMRGLLTCEKCGCNLTATQKKGHNYYYCTNGKKNCDQHRSYLREEKIFEMVGDVLGGLHFSERKIELMYRAAKEKLDNEKSDESYILKNLEENLAGLDRRESRLLDTYLAEQITQDLYEIKYKEIKRERIDLKQQIHKAKQEDRFSTLEQVKTVFMDCSRAKSKFLNADEYRKRNIAEKLLWNATIENKKIAQLSYKFPYQLLAKTPKNSDFSKMLGR